MKLALQGRYGLSPRVVLLFLGVSCVGCSRRESSDSALLLEQQAQAASLQPVTPQAPSDLYPIISPLVGGNSYAIAHASDYDIARDPNEVPAAPLADGATVTFGVTEMNTVIAPAEPALNPPVWSGASDVRMNFMAFGATTDDGSVPRGYWTPRVPGPFLKVVANRTVNVVLSNSAKNTNTHSIDFHSVVGLKGGAAMIMAAPGAKAALAIKPTHPGLYVYHCSESGTPNGIAEHMNMGMYGMMLVLPGDEKGNQDADDRFIRMLAGASEHYIFEEDVFRDRNGNFDQLKMLNTLVPDFVTYNGRISSLVDHPLSGSKAAGNYVIYHGAGGAHIPSFHIIGAIYDRTWNQGDITSSPLRGLQTVMIPSAGTAVMEIDQSNLIVNATSSGVVGDQLDILVDHASPYFRKGALGLMLVTP
ncbi:MAG: multicopper oxidase domain-containing protein [Myxococcota bacterium]|nr:multicopper oxidase domain-containing protein [Myxococcota bacterium]